MNTNSNMEDRILALSEGAKGAIVLSAPAFRFGGNWAFIKKDDANYEATINALNLEKPNIQLYRVSNGALILCNERFLAFNINAIVPNAISTPFVEMAAKRRNDEKELFNKFIGKVIEGKSKYVKSKDGFYELVIGIYSVNDVNVIMCNNIEYPAYKLNMLEALEFARTIARTGKSIYAKAVIDDKVTYVPLASVSGNSKAFEVLYKGLEISPTKTGIFLTLRIKG